MARKENPLDVTTALVLGAFTAWGLYALVNRDKKDAPAKTSAPPPEGAQAALSDLQTGPGLQEDYAQPPCGKDVVYVFAERPQQQMIYTYRQAFVQENGQWRWAGKVGEFGATQLGYLPDWIVNSPSWTDGEKVAPVMLGPIGYPNLDSNVLDAVEGGIYQGWGLDQNGFRIVKPGLKVWVELWTWTDTGWCRKKVFSS